MATAFDLSASLDRARVRAGAEAEVKCHIKLSVTPGFLPPAPTLTTSVCLLFDCSASMMGRKLETCIDAAKRIVDTIHPRHRISLVGFQSRTYLLVDNAQATDAEKDNIKHQIDKVRSLARGSTNLADGIKHAQRALESQPAHAKLMVILSDGRADSPPDALKAGFDATRAGIQLHAVGIGAEYEADHLLKLVTPSNGAVFGDADLDQIKTTLASLVGRIERFVATRARLDVRWAEGVRPGPVYKSSPEQAFLGTLTPDAARQIQLQVGSIELEKSYAFLLCATAPARPAGEVEIAHATLTYNVPSIGERRQEVGVSLTYAADQSTVWSDDVLKAYRGASVAQMAQELAEAHRRGDVKKVGECLDTLVRTADEMGDGRLRTHYQDMRAELKRKGTLSRAMLNASVVASTAKGTPATERPVAPTVEAQAERPTVQLPAVNAGPTLYDVVLVDPGAELIRVIRELRDVTGLGLRQVSDMVKAPPAAIREALPLADATALQKRVQVTGARVEVRPQEKVAALSGPPA